MINKFNILNGAKYFSLGIFQNYLVFTPATKHIKHFHGSTQIYSWKSSGMSGESIENVTKSDSNFAETFVDHHSLPNIKFNGYCLIKNISIPKKITNLYISYRLGRQLRSSNTDFTLSNYCLFGYVKLTKNADLDKYTYTGYGIGFDSLSEFSFTDAMEKVSVLLELLWARLCIISENIS